MNVMVIGSGGREHALAWKLSQSRHVDKLYVAPGNAGTESVAENVPIAATDIEKLARFGRRHDVGLTIVGPDDPLALGIVDLFEAEGLVVFGPRKTAAKIEASKAYSKHLMHKQGIPTADFVTFDEYDEALEYVERQTFPLFIKASGLAQGKGAVGCASMGDAKKTLKAVMVEKIFGEAGNSVVIESLLNGPEFSLHALCNGTDYVMLPSSQDHKPVFDGDEGPNTGGMGTVAPLPWVDPSMVESLGQKVVALLLEGLIDESAPFKGLLYPGLKLTADGAKVIEYNARFGDPETQVYMRLLDSDLLEVLEAAARGNLEGRDLHWQPDTYAVNVALVSGGYPSAYQKGFPITGIDEANALDDVVVFHSGTTRQNGAVVTNGGRVLYVSATGSTLVEAQQKAYYGVSLIHFEGMHYRRDIGDMAIKLSAR